MPGSSTTPGQTGAGDNAPVHVAFRVSEHVGTRDNLVFAAQWLAYALPCRRFADTLTDASARLGADVDRYSFTAVDLHHLLFAGFDRRTRTQDFAPRCRCRQNSHMARAEIWCEHRADSGAPPAWAWPAR
jgi:hypothetical protein